MNASKKKKLVSSFGKEDFSNPHQKVQKLLSSRFKSAIKKSDVSLLEVTDKEVLFRIERDFCFLEALLSSEMESIEIVHPSTWVKFV